LGRRSEVPSIQPSFEGAGVIQPSFEVNVEEGAGDGGGDGRATVMEMTSSIAGCSSSTSPGRVLLGGDELLRRRVSAKNRSRVRRDLLFVLTMGFSSTPIQPSPSSSNAGLDGLDGQESPSASPPYSETESRGVERVKTFGTDLCSCCGAADFSRSTIARVLEGGGRRRLNASCRKAGRSVRVWDAGAGSTPL
jgi:hypothetical protein